ncbi:type II toxin-antitoxin system VapC family toxin [Silvibacterium dinghuense]|uniref:Ribonuclease VapC n=1 Tax=Silvibacterium dinghuense TaxID=1560006 RepID=A0A4Q1SBR6_9BACT|nr:type II toxin-antitoxin system VapC family toxin [Silvibacterium dinghuense]RXS94443.1 type II toxin-antitoxin system VapC family toxin [Silvibacterium dinghuense]GGH16068.1 ribonuclease VapC [Silvibacterium dinghuense]
MGARYLLDTNTFSYIATGISPAARAEFQRLLHDPAAEVCISSITEAEVRYGMAKRALGPTRTRAIESLLLTVDILPWDSSAASVYGKARVAIEALGITVAAMDMLIGAHAASVGAVLVTRDSIFESIGTMLHLTATANWATDLP